MCFTLEVGNLVSVHHDAEKWKQYIQVPVHLQVLDHHLYGKEIPL